MQKLTNISFLDDDFSLVKSQECDRSLTTLLLPRVKINRWDIPIP
ncbi:hypothetical protein B6N60_00029 [Richelia sinica FACHB-800]|uniref:Uncharacterized protein n=1 Tax=Richelia sinica FACHB-800 TaxID=1357546 RepID=A0A975T3E7_9NOST|nr:hypothetical protein B6N60_00029 [Richelia sinica FACHB-800]